MGEIWKRIKITGTKKSKSVKALLDSGATISVIDKKLADEIGMPDYGIVEGELANGKKTKGTLSNMRVTIAGGSMGADVVIVNKLKDKVILGVDFLQARDINIDWKEEKVKVPPIYKKRRFRL